MSEYFELRIMPSEVRSVVKSSEHPAFFSNHRQWDPSLEICNEFETTYNDWMQTYHNTRSKLSQAILWTFRIYLNKINS